VRKTIVILLIIITATIAALYLVRGVFLGKFRNYLVKKIETSSDRGIKIESIDYIPTKGIRLSGVKTYTDTRYMQTIFSITYLDVKFSVLKLLADRVFAPTVTLHNLSLGNASINGSFAFSLGPGGKIETLMFKNLSVRTPVIKVQDLTGSVDMSGKSIKTSGMHFTLGKESCELSFEISHPAGKFSSNFEIHSPNLNLSASIGKEDGIYRIKEINGRFLTSSFEFIGELESLKVPGLSLYGKANIDIKDVAYFAPEELKRTMEILKPAGKAVGSLYFKGNLKNPSGWEVGIKFEAEHINLWNFKFSDCHTDMRLKDGVVLVPLISAYPYNGVFVSSFQIDLNDNSMPYEADCKLSGINIADMLEGTKLGRNNLQGFLSSEFAIHGSAKSLSSMRGSGRISVRDANLGPMPVLTPLIGNLYGYLRHIFPELNRIDITRGSCNFMIADRKISTENLVLMGDVIGIYARGYMDFDKNLNFDIENELIKPEGTSDTDWQTTVRGMVINFGKFISKSRLGGTLEDPKWSFEYMSGIKNILGGGLDKILKGVFSE